MLGATPKPPHRTASLQHPHSIENNYASWPSFHLLRSIVSNITTAEPNKADALVFLSQFSDSPMTAGDPRGSRRGSHGCFILNGAPFINNLGIIDFLGATWTDYSHGDQGTTFKTQLVLPIRPSESS